MMQMTKTFNKDAASSQLKIAAMEAMTKNSKSMPLKIKGEMKFNEMAQMMQQIKIIENRVLAKTKIDLFSFGIIEMLDVK